MPWNPTTELTGLAVRGDNLEQDTLALWEEFLGGYFSNQSFVIIRDPKSFPAVTRLYQQDALKAILAGAAIAVTILKQSKPRRYDFGATRRAYHQVSFTFWVKAKGDNTGTGPKTLVTRTADSLFGLLNHKARTLPLARKGIRHVRAENPKLEPSTDFYTRSLVVHAELQYVLDELTEGVGADVDQMVTGSGDFFLFGNDFWIV